jgi:hypothetical protein
MSSFDNMTTNDGLDEKGNYIYYNDLNGGIDFSALNPKNWGINDYSNLKSFNEAYKIAKTNGENNFMWNGKRFNTSYAGTPRQEIGAYGINGKPVSKEMLNNEAILNYYLALNNNKFLPGHIEAEAEFEDRPYSIDYNDYGNNNYGINTEKERGKKTYNVYGLNKERFKEKALSLPDGIKWNSTYDLYTNNCADNICDAFDIPRNKILTTPKYAKNQILNKYPTIESTGRTYDDYYNSFEKEKNILKNAKYWLGISSSPDIVNTPLRKEIVEKIQKESNKSK